MKILAIDTSTLLGGVAVAEASSGLIAEVRLNIKSTHSERLMTAIDSVMKLSGHRIDDMDVFGVAIGPGSFTGLRIGLSTVKGFSFATGKPVVSVPTLEAFAWNFPYSGYPVCPMLDARKKEVYTALFQWKEKGFERLIPEASVSLDDFLAKASGLAGGAIVFAGEGALLYRKEIIRLMGERALFAAHGKTVPLPSNVAFLGLSKALREEFSEPVSLVPAYIRKSEAEIKSDARNTHS